jgi:hypothetical protein
MERIGIAASKMSKGNLLTYNLFVVLISFLCSLFILFICGFSVLVALFLISVVFRFFMPQGFNTDLLPVAKICMVALSILVGGLNIAAIVRNIKLTKQKI